MERTAARLICLAALWLASLAPAWAAEVYRIGVLAYRGQEAAVAEWSGHVDYLNRHLAPLRFELAPMTWQQLAESARKRDIHFVITNPGNYTEMAIAGTANRIATRLMIGPTGTLDRFGGVAIARANRTDLRTYADLRGKRLLIPDYSSLGGWQVHLGEGLAQGIDLRTDTASIEETRNHEKVVFGILAGYADAGFVRTDLLEHMALTGRIRLDDLHVINARQEAGFPYLLSTRLYPEWPIARVEGTPDEVTRKVLIALLGMSADDPAARAAGLVGWNIPLSYQSINDLFYRARLGPYQELPITLHDVMLRYGRTVAIVVGGVLLVVSLALFVTLRANRALRRARNELAGREESFRTLVTNVPGAVYRRAADARWSALYVSEHVQDICGLPAADFMAGRHHFADLVHADDRAKIEREIDACLTSGQPYVLEYRIVRDNGQVRWLLDHGRAHYDLAGKVNWLDGVVLDITAAKQAEVKLRQAATVFEYTQEGILVTDAQPCILAANPAFVAISGYSELELLGQSPALLGSGRHDPAFFANLWRELEQHGHWQGEIWNRRRNGEVYPSWQTINTLRDERGRVTGYISLCSDITHTKQSDERLHWLAYHDPLTGLANRLLFEERLDHAIRLATRRGERLAVLYFDLDGFKAINDNLGHQAGDELLEAIGRRLGARLRKSDTLSRRGGDEFTVLVENLGGVAEVEAVAEDILRQMGKPFALPAGHEINCRCSIGIALFPEDSEEVQELLRCADFAMYRAKEDGGGRYRLFSAAQT
ncbi:diguanylate cyclase [Parasulfuritortus cantonensis]|uniref:Diguanylate cyclase n=1 Tax=Parasulfuritortus cantonensis TaxID=2528202 RepID=A0A4R1BKU9_9PROT|nr:diguanylate cyclase [Parasulfuritortus cantonensis]TCJ18031.1 diguanylate cyclase [Parasulfuritortus cantonensis]